MYGDVVLGLKPEQKEQDPFEEILEAKKRARGVESDADLTADDLRELVTEFKDLIRNRLGVAFPSRAGGAALGRDRRGLRLVEQRPRDHLPQALRHPRGMGHGGQRPGDGLRQPRRRLRDRRRLLARPRDRRERPLRRVPAERPGRGRRRRHPSAAAAPPRGLDRARAGPGHQRGRARGTVPVARGADARRLQAAPQDRAPARAALSRHAGPRVHDRAPPPVDAADPQRQAHRVPPR